MFERSNSEDWSNHWPWTDHVFHFLVPLDVSFIIPDWTFYLVVVFFNLNYLSMQQTLCAVHADKILRRVDQIRLLIYLEYENVRPGWGPLICFLLLWQLSIISVDLILVHGFKKKFIRMCLVVFCSLLVTVHFADWKPMMVLLRTSRYWTTSELEGLRKRLPSQLLRLSMRSFLCHDIAGPALFLG